MSSASTIYGVTLAALLVGSYLAWTREDKAEESADVVLVDLKPEELEKLTYTSEKLDLELSARKDDLGPYFWVKSTERKEKKPPKKPKDEHDHGGEHAEGEEPEGEPEAEEAEAEAPPEIEVVTKAFKAGKEGDKLLASFTPFKAERELTVSPDKLADFGLDAPKETLLVSPAGKGARTFELGGEAYGTKDRYVREKETGKVYLVEAQTVSALKTGNTSLPDRELLGVEEKALTRLKITSPQGGLELEHQNRADAEAAYWRTVGEDGPNESAGTWLEKLFKLTSSSYVQPAEIPTALEPAFTVSVITEDDKTIQLEVVKGANPNGVETWYARSTHTREWVELHKSPASQATEDLSTILE